MFYREMQNAIPESHRKASGTSVANPLSCHDIVSYLLDIFLQLCYFLGTLLTEASISSNSDITIFSCSMSLMSCQDRNRDVVRQPALVMNCSS